MRQNHRIERPHAAVWMDTETDQVPLPDGGVKHVLRFGWVLYQRTRRGGEWTAPEWYRFTTNEEYWSWIEARCRAHTRLYLFAHNQSFDAVVTHAFTELPRRGWKLLTAIIDSPPTILRWRRGTCTIQVLDTMNWWRHSLKVIGQSIGLPKLTMPAQDAPQEEWDIYARRDVEVIHKAIHAWWDFLKTHRFGGFAPTLASQAFRAFRHRFMDHPILLDDNPEALNLARAAFYGGRVEAFRVGEIQGPIHQFDVNSMYPAVMYGHDYPTILRLHTRSVTLAELARWVETCCVVARVRLRTSRAIYPVRYKGRLLFPTGDIITTLSTPELIEALKQNVIESCQEAAVYDRAPIFTRFVEECYALRRAAQDAGDAVQTWLMKILMNSLYGKFAQHGAKWDVIAQTVEMTPRAWLEIDAETGAVRHFRQLGGAIQERFDAGESRDSHPAIAAHVTAHARHRLHELMGIAGWDNVWYVDTDSLFTTEEGAKRLSSEIDTTRLGALKPEGLHAWMTIHGAKDYVLPAKVVTKGVRGAARWLDERTIEHEEWSSLVGLVRKGNLVAPTTIPRQKVLRRVYEKRRVMDDGSTAPWYWLGDRPARPDFPAW